MGTVLACWYLSASILITMSFLMMSEVGAMVVVWICVLGLAVFYGYCRRLHACYVDIMRYHPQLIHKYESKDLLPTVLISRYYSGYF
jgi:hypothetical protein